MKRLKHTAAQGVMVVYTVSDGTSYIFRSSDSWELDITDDVHADELLLNEVFQDVTS